MRMQAGVLRPAHAKWLWLPPPRSFRPPLLTMGRPSPTLRLRNDC